MADNGYPIFTAQDVQDIFASMNRQWCVIHHRVPDEVHRGPYDTEEEARSWVEEAEEDGFKPGTFLVKSRIVGNWE